MLVPPGSRKTPKQSEADVQKAIRDYLQAHGWRIIRQQSGMFTNTGGGTFRIGEPGMADIQAVRYVPASGDSHQGKAYVFWCETKAPDAVMRCRCHLKKRGKCTACAQRDWKATETRLGALFAPGHSISVFLEWYDKYFGWLHRSGLPGQAEMF